MSKASRAFLLYCYAVATAQAQGAQATKIIVVPTTTEAATHYQTNKFTAWLAANADPATSLPYSHIGDEHFSHWTLTYDAAVTVMAWTAVGRLDRAQRILNYYLQDSMIWRLGGIIEAVNTSSSALGEDWSVRTGSNIWMGLAAIRVYQATKNDNDLTLAKRLGDFALSLQDTDTRSDTFGGIRLGPAGNPNVVGDQHLNYDANQPNFKEIFATEHNIDAYALFGLIYHMTGERKYLRGQERVLHWLKTIAFNHLEHRFNRGYLRSVDKGIATDVQSWGISALGIEVLDGFEPDLAEKMIAFIEDNCVTETEFQKPHGPLVTVRGVDFVDRGTARTLGRKPLVSPEWTFQLVNAYLRLESDFILRRDLRRAAVYRRKRAEFLQGMLSSAIPTATGWGYPYATQGEALIGHEYRTPAAGTLSTIGVAYAVLALAGYDPLSFSTKTQSGNIKK